MAKNLWHKDLKGFGQVQVVVKSGRQKSKFSKPGNEKPDFVNLVVNGEEYSYSTENEACATFWQPYVGKTITIVADGRAEDATIQYLGQPGSQVAAPAAQQQPPAQTQQPPPQQEQRRGPQPNTATGPATGTAAAPHAVQQPKDVGLAFRHFVGRNHAMAITALQAAVDIKQKFEDAFQVIMPESTFTAVYNSMLFGSNNAGFLASNHDMPMGTVFKPLDKPLVEAMR